jgi:hypothetical protein
MDLRSLGGAVVALTLLPAAPAVGCSESRSLKLTDLRDATLPYYYVGPSFDGLTVSHVERYHNGVAEILYGTCKAGSDGGCPLPLELQHRLCHGHVTVVIFTGQGAKNGSATRAAEALRPLSHGARGQKPAVAYDQAPACS